MIQSADGVKDDFDQYQQHQQHGTYANLIGTEPTAAAFVQNFYANYVPYPSPQQAGINDGNGAAWSATSPEHLAFLTGTYDLQAFEQFNFGYQPAYNFGYTAPGDYTAWTSIQQQHAAAALAAVNNNNNTNTRKGVYDEYYRTTNNNNNNNNNERYVQQQHNTSDNSNDEQLEGKMSSLNVSDNNNNNQKQYDDQKSSKTYTLATNGQKSTAKTYSNSNNNKSWASVVSSASSNTSTTPTQTTTTTNTQQNNTNKRLTTNNTTTTTTTSITTPTNTQLFTNTNLRSSSNNNNTKYFSPTHPNANLNVAVAAAYANMYAAQPIMQHTPHYNNRLFNANQRINNNNNNNNIYTANNNLQYQQQQQQPNQKHYQNYNNGLQQTDMEQQSPQSQQNNILAKLKIQNQYNPKEFNLVPKGARFFVIKSYSEDDIHRSIKYNIWCSTEHGNRRLDQAFREREGKGPVYLFFSVNGSGHFCGMAEMMSCVDYDSKSDVWSQDKWKGKFDVKWIYVKDVPNLQLRNIRLENNDNKPVTNSRDTQEIPFEKGKQVLKVFHHYRNTTSIFDDFEHYERRQDEDYKRPNSNNTSLTNNNNKSPSPTSTNKNSNNTSPQQVNMNNANVQNTTNDTTVKSVA